MAHRALQVTHVVTNRYKIYRRVKYYLFRGNVSVLLGL